MDPVLSPRGSIASHEAASINTAPTTITSSTDTSSLPLIKFQSVELLAQQISRTPGDVLLVEAVSPEDFENIRRFRETNNRKYRFKRYYSDRGLLIITIPTHYHECMHSYLYTRIIIQIDRIGLTNYWFPFTGTTFFEQHGRTGAGEGDSSGGPFQPHQQSLRDWPTLVIEAGYSQSLPQLQADMRWWISESNHQVKVVILIKMHPGPLREVDIEHWREEPINFPGARTRGRAQQVEPTLEQAIKIVKNSTAANDFLLSSYSVTRGALELRFSDLFLRDPGPGEGNFIISVEELQQLGVTLAQRLRDH